MRNPYTTQYSGRRGKKDSHPRSKQIRQVVERYGHFVVVRPQRLLLDVDSAEVDSLRFRVFTLNGTRACS